MRGQHVFKIYNSLNKSHPFRPRINETSMTTTRFILNFKIRAIISFLISIAADWANFSWCAHTLSTCTWHRFCSLYYIFIYSRSTWIFCFLPILVHKLIQFRKEEQHAQREFKAMRKTKRNLASNFSYYFLFTLLIWIFKTKTIPMNDNDKSIDDFFLDQR